MKKQNLILNVTQDIILMEFLVNSLINESRNNIKSLLAHKQILVNGNIVSQYDYQLNEKDTVSVNFSLIRATEKNKNKENDLLEIIYEDDDIIAINKPCGLLSIATAKERTLTAYHILLEYVKKKNKNNRIFIVHRLDQDTSGVFMVAKNEDMKNSLQHNWNEITKERGYIAIVEGKLEKKSDTITSYLKETPSYFVYSSDDKLNGKEAITKYYVLKENSRYSMLQINLKTGRKNQIRVHMSDIRHPVIGDKKYEALKNPINRLGLHANRLSFIHPKTKKLFTLEAKIPQNFESMFSKSDNR